MPDVRICKTKDCELEAATRRQWCEECWYNRQPPLVKVEAAQRRRELVPEEFRIAKVHESKWPPGRRWCSNCQTFVRLTDCAGSRCRACASIASHRSRMKATFGIDDATMQWLRNVQLDRCAICRGKARTVRLALDHRHGHEACGGKGCRGCWRGLACSRCNAELLGAAHDSIEILENALRYLKTPPMSGEWEPPAGEVEEWRAKHPDQAIVPF